MYTYVGTKSRSCRGTRQPEHCRRASWWNPLLARRWQTSFGRDRPGLRKSGPGADFMKQFWPEVTLKNFSSANYMVCKFLGL
jgi:hypothetical protein